MSYWSWVPSLIETGISLWGASKAADANQRATDVAVQQQGRATEAELEALRMAEQKQKEMQAAASPGLMQMQRIIGRGEGLTPEQKIAMEDARRTTLDALQGGGLRGSARATVSAVNDVDGRMRANFIGQNRQQTDDAARALSGQYFNAGNNITNIMGQQGQAASQGLMNTGQNLVDSIKNDTAIKGTAMGDIGAVIADQLKSNINDKRNSSYESLDNDQISWYAPRKGAV